MTENIRAALNQLMAACGLRGESGSEKLYYALRSVLDDNGIDDEIKDSHADGLCLDVTWTIAERLEKALAK